MITSLRQKWDEVQINSYIRQTYIAYRKDLHWVPPPGKHHSVIYLFHWIQIKDEFSKLFTQKNIKFKTACTSGHRHTNLDKDFASRMVHFPEGLRSLSSLFRQKQERDWYSF